MYPFCKFHSILSRKINESRCYFETHPFILLFSDLFIMNGYYPSLSISKLTNFAVRSRNHPLIFKNLSFVSGTLLNCILDQGKNPDIVVYKTKCNAICWIKFVFILLGYCNTLLVLLPFILIIDWAIYVFFL